MTRERLDDLRALTLAYRDAVRREQMMMEASRAARQKREAASRDLAEVLQAAEIPEGMGFEHAGIVVWWDGEPRLRNGLHHVFLAFYRESLR